MTKPQGSRKLSHIDADGQVRMVNVGHKVPSQRIAAAEGWIRMQQETMEAIRQDTLEKGDVLTVAQIAGITGGKRAAEWIPMCHPLPIDGIDVSLTLDDDLPGVHARARAQVTARTGAEMEALVAVSNALLTVYDMCKSVDREMELGGIRLTEKRGGQSGSWQREETE